MKTTDDLRYPVGQFDPEGAITDEARQSLIAEIADAPRRLREAVAGLSPEQLDTPYRPGGWTVRQVVHHVPDSHLNSYVRFKLALTEDEPAIRTYHEELWAELPDSRATPVGVSLGTACRKRAGLPIVRLRNAECGLKSTQALCWKSAIRNPHSAIPSPARYRRRF
ncbi:MAG: putative metal-dependent hydrolase [Acidobacteria bacterium]|nr:putative metal-dependent hydrolase [Acidobacteriota bacterium]